MKRVLKYNPTNQNSLFAGFTPELSFSAGKNPFISNENSLLIVYLNFTIYRKEISPWGELLPPWGDSFSLWGDLFAPWVVSFSPWREPFPLWGDSFSLWGEPFPPGGDSFSPAGKSLPPWGKRWLMHRKLMVMINKECLLRNKAFSSGYKAIIFVRTLFRKRKRVFPNSFELFRQWSIASPFGKNCMVLN